MSAPLESSAAPAAEVCPLCRASVESGATRCSACGYHLAGVGDRPGPWTRAALWWTAAGLLIVYAVTLLIVALAR